MTATREPIAILLELAKRPVVTHLYGVRLEDLTREELIGAFRFEQDVSDCLRQSLRLKEQK